MSLASLTTEMPNHAYQHKFSQAELPEQFVALSPALSKPDLAKAAASIARRKS
jgi:hypothetical protein